MKSLSRISLAALMALGAPAVHAEESQGYLPVALGSACNYQVMVPENSMGYIPSEDCKTIYILPQATAEFEVPSFLPTANTLLCSGLEAYLKTQSRINEDIQRLVEQVFKTQSRSQRAVIQAKIDALEKYKKLGSDIYKGKEGALAQLVFKSVTDQSTINKWALANLEIMRASGVNFAPATIGTSVLTFSSATTEDKETAALIRHSIPGLKVQEDGDYKSVLFNGSLSGQVVFSLYGACSLLSKTPKSLDEVNTVKYDSQKAGASLIVNREFQVPTRTKMSYRAKLNQEQSILYLQEFMQTRPNSFTVSEFLDQKSEADLKNLVEFEVETNMLSQQQAANWDKIKANVYTEVTTRLVKTLADALVGLKKLDIVPLNRTEAPAAGVVQQPHTRRSCSSSSIFGITYSSSCGDETYYVPVLVAGRSDLMDVQKLDLKVNLTESMKMNDIYNHTFTQAFVPKSEN